MTVPVVFAIAGVVALFLSIWGGIKAKEIVIPPPPPKARVIVGLLGFVFIGVSIWLSIPNIDSSQPVLFETPTSLAATPTSIPISTNITALPSIIDNFDTQAFDGNFNSDYWIYQNLKYEQIYQGNGILTIICSQISDCSTGLSARNYHFIPFSSLISGSGIFFEAKVKLDTQERNGNVSLQIYSDNVSGGYWWTQCTLSNSGTKEQVACNIYPQNHVLSGEFDEYGTWHTFRIEIDSTKMTFNYYIDGVMIDFVPLDIESLRKANFSFNIGVNGANVEGYFDDVRIGRIKP